jgi:ribosome-binding protein aMBF1 (putative translation factor)
MKHHTRTYLDYFNYGIEDFIPCEVCGSRAQDVHHVRARGMGGSKYRDHIDNLMGVCRHCHIKFGDKKQYMDFLRDTHEEFMNKSVNSHYK